MPRPPAPDAESLPLPKSLDAPSTAVLQVQNLRFAWPGQPPLFDGLTITLGPGLHAVCGDDGCGKSTLLALLAGEHASHTGSVLVDDVSLAADREAYQARVFWIDPATDAFDAVSARAFLATQPEHHPGFEPAIAHDLAEALGLTPHLDKPLHMLSAGSKRKVWLSAAMASGVGIGFSNAQKHESERQHPQKAQKHIDQKFKPERRAVEQRHNKKCRRDIKRQADQQQNQ